MAAEVHPAPNADEASPSPRRAWTRADVLTWSAIGAWGAVMVTVCAYMLGGHLVTLPSPTPTSPRLTAAVAERRPEAAAPGWTALHVLYGDCGCSRRVIRHLAERKPTALAHEHVVLVDPEDGDVERLERAGFPVEVMAVDALGPRLDVAAVPLYVLAEPTGELAYVGGYTDRKRGPDIEDLDILAELRAGQPVPSLPLFGCATNQALASQVDPLGLR